MLVFVMAGLAYFVPSILSTGLGRLTTVCSLLLGDLTTKTKLYPNPLAKSIHKTHINNFLLLNKGCRIED